MTVRHLDGDGGGLMRDYMREPTEQGQDGVLAVTPGQLGIT